METNLLSQMLILSISFTWLINHSGFIVSLSEWLYTRLNKNKQWLGQMIPKPWSCALCMTFWVTLIIGLFNTNIVYAIGYASAFSFLTIVIDKIITVIIKLLNKIQ